MSTGYIESLDGNALLDFAIDNDTVVRMERGVGEFVIEGRPIVSVADSLSLTDEIVDAINSFYVVNRQRSVQQDAAFGIRQIADVALKALSPGINDTTTAVMCVEYLAAILVQLANRDIPDSHRIKDGKLRVIARGASFESLVAEAFNQIRQNASGNVAVLARQAELLGAINTATNDAQRQSCLRRQVELVAIVAQRSIAPHDIEPIETAANLLLRATSPPSNLP